MNFNTNSKVEYDLNDNLVNEMINLYGVQTKFLVVEKINKDIIFGDYSHIKTDSTKIFDIFVLPENTEDWDENDYGFSQFGFTNVENINVFVSKRSFNNVFNDDNYLKIIGNLLVFPNNKIMEITNVSATVPGINNLFTYNDAKTVYKLTCIPYHNKLINELDQTDISTQKDENDEVIDYSTLDNYFNELTSEETELTNEVEVNASVDNVVNNGDTDTSNKTTILVQEDDIFGKF